MDSNVLMYWPVWNFLGCYPGGLADICLDCTGPFYAIIGCFTPAGNVQYLYCTVVYHSDLLAMPDGVLYRPGEGGANNARPMPQ